MMRKKLVSMLLMCCLMIVQPSARVLADLEAGDGADEEETVSFRFAYVNPLYEGVISGDDLHRPVEINRGNRAPRARSAEISHTSVEAAGAYVRERMEAREETITLSYVTEDADYGHLMGDIVTAALAHTGKPTQGDYLAFQYGGYDGRGSVRKSGGLYYLTLTYTMTYYTTAAQEAEMDAAVEALLESLDLSEMGDYEKTRAIYDDICGSVTYDNANLNDDTYRLKYTAYAALRNKTAVCQGYAVLLYRLLLESGVDCRVISGTGKGEAHAWNIVRLGGLYYDADSTWDAGKGDYTYFLRCDENFANHVRDDAHRGAAFYEEYPMASRDFAAEIGTIGSSEEGITVEVTCVRDDAAVFCAAYTGNGKMLAIASLPAKGDGKAYPYNFSFAGVKYDCVRVFVLGQGSEPLCVDAAT